MLWSNGCGSKMFELVQQMFQVPVKEFSDVGEVW